MTLNEYKTLDELIERYMDNNGMESLMNIISIICVEKADHVRASYSDGEAMAELWEARADLIATFVHDTWR
jgi:hypothetical protein